MRIWCTIRVKAGSEINIVAIVRDGWHEPGWSAPGKPADLHAALRALRAGGAGAASRFPDSWQKWALFDRAPRRVARARSGHTIRRCRTSDAAVSCAGRRDGDRGCGRAGRLPRRKTTTPRAALRSLRAGAQRPRRTRPARGAGNSWRYHLSGPLGMARDAGSRMMGGEKLLRRYDWLYDWKA